MRTFVDSGVLIAAARGVGELGIRALTLFNEPTRVWLSSAFVRLEVFPKEEVPLSAALVTQAYTEACAAGLASVDALHIAAAKLGGADVFVTTERPTSPRAPS